VKVHCFPFLFFSQLLLETTPTLEDIFALMILYCDGYFSLKEGLATEREIRAQKFFSVCKKLNVDLNMILARRVYLSDNEFILSDQTEAALRRVLSWQFL